MIAMYNCRLGNIVARIRFSKQQHAGVLLLMITLSRIKISAILSLLLASTVASPVAPAAAITGGKIHILPGETEDPVQSNTYVKLIHHKDGSAQVFYHDPDSGNRLIGRNIPAGQTLQISYWSTDGQRLRQVVRTAVHTESPRTALPSSASGSTASASSTSAPATTSASRPSAATAGSATANSVPGAATDNPTASKADSTDVFSTEPSSETAATAPATTNALTGASANEATTASPEAQLLAQAAPPLQAVPLKAMPLPTVVPVIRKVAAAGDSFISAVDSSVGPCAWKKFPIKVFIDTAPVATAAQLQQEVKDAFETWTRASGNKLRFEFVPSQSADIVLTWVGSVAGFKNPKEAGEASVDYHAVGSAKRTLQNPGDIKVAHVKLLSKDINQHEWQPGELRLVALHEIGHALGIFGHSLKAGDIMYSEKGASELSARDINTINILYEFSPGD
jgi:predicted Zn-dependent protease